MKIKESNIYDILIPQDYSPSLFTMLSTDKLNVSLLTDPFRALRSHPAHPIRKRNAHRGPWRQQ